MSAEDGSTLASKCVLPGSDYLHPPWGQRHKTHFGTFAIFASMVPLDLETETQYLIQEISLLHTMYEEAK